MDWDAVQAGSCDCCGHIRSEHQLEGCAADWAGMQCPCAVSWGVDFPLAECHVIPTADLIEHEETTRCGCLPHVELVPGAHGLAGCVVTHAAWDGRA